MSLPLNQIMQYTNPSVLNRYTKDYPKNHLQAPEALRELLKYLWLSQLHAQEKSVHPENTELHFVCAIHNEMGEIDDMWHTFLLFTQDYLSFCNQFFGQFMHHLPTSDEQKQSKDEFKTDFTRYLIYIQKKLGQETLRTWFSSLTNQP